MLITTSHEKEIMEGMGDKKRSAREYQRFINSVRAGDKADYARQRLVEWGFVEAE